MANSALIKSLENIMRIDDGVDGDSFFQDVTQDESNVYFTLADGRIIY